jgi:hypothetical protein
VVADLELFASILPTGPWAKWVYEGSVKKVGLVKFLPRRPFAVPGSAFLRCK